MIKLIIVLLAIIASAIGSVGALYLKRASKKFKLNLRYLFRTLFELNLILGLLFYFISSTIVVILLKNNELSFIYPLTSLTYVFVTLISWKYLNEKINIYKALAIFLIMIGVLLVALS